MTHASVFSGIGGPEVAASMLGWENLFHCEINPFGRAVLEYWFPNATSYEDITKTDFSEWRGKVNVLTGGFPCQPFSYAGQRRGEKDDRYLWPYMHKCINQVRPDWVVCENVGGILTMVEQGSVTDMAVEKSLFSEGDALHRYRLEETFTLERISEDLGNDGYAVQAVIIPACAVNAPHRRDRVFIIGCRNDIADTTSKDGNRWSAQVRQERETITNNKEHTIFPSAERFGGEWSITDPSLMHLNGCITGDGCNDRRQQKPELGSRDCTTTERGNVPDTIRKGLERQDQPRCGETGQRVHLRRDPARCDRQDDQERTTAAHPDCNRGGEMDEHLQPRLADGAKPVGNGRERIVTDTGSERLQTGHRGREAGEAGRNASSWNRGSDCQDGGGRTDTYTDGDRFQETGARKQAAMPLRDDLRDGKRNEKHERGEGIAGCGRWDEFPTQSPVHRGNDGIPFPMDCLTISPSKWRTESLKAYGNAIVPQVMYEIFRAIESTQNMLSNEH